MLPKGGPWSGEGNMSCRNSCSAREQYLHSTEGVATMHSDHAWRGCAWAGHDSPVRPTRHHGMQLPRLFLAAA